MRRGRASAMLAALAATACGGPPTRTVAPVAPVAPVASAGGPSIRVGIVVDRDSALVGGVGPFVVVAADGGVAGAGDPGRPWVARLADGGRVALYRPGAAEPLRLEPPVVVRPEVEGGLVTIGALRYRGEAVVQRGSAGVTVVNRLPLEPYLLSVVALELGFRAPEDRQAVMAQAVAARTYALRFMGRREALGFDVFPTDADQVYGGVAAELPEVADAVDRTRGEIATWEGRPIQALFHSTCGWSTEAAEEVFQNRDTVPYLRAVSDRFGDGPRDYYCARSPRFRWEETWEGAALEAVAARIRGSGNGGTNGDIVMRDLRVSRETPTGRVAELTVESSAGSNTVSRGRIREVLRPSAGGMLNSTMFQLAVERDGDAVRRVVARGGGYGHGVGMCQFGASGRSRAGQDYRSILATYYHGITVERSY